MKIDFVFDVKFDLNKEIIQLLFFKVVVEYDRTPLHLACYRESALVCRYPACEFPSAQLAKALLMVGADPNARDEGGNTPLHLAALARPCPSELAQVLLDYGAHLVRNYTFLFANQVKSMFLLFYCRTFEMVPVIHSNHFYRIKKFTN